MAFAGNDDWHDHQRRDYTPITYIGTIPVTVTNLLIAAHILSMVVCAIMLSAQMGPWLVKYILFSSSGFWEGKVWTILTDPFFHNIVSENIWFVIGMLMLWWFGREVESYIGRSRYCLLYLLLLIIPAGVCLLVSGLTPFDMAIGNRGQAHFAIFLGFAMLYPNVLLFPGIPVKWIALVFIAINILILIASGSWLDLFPYLGCLATLYLFMDYIGVRRGFSLLEPIEDWLQGRKQKAQSLRTEKIAKKKRASEEEIDQILDKINESGLQSLSDRERKILEQMGKKLKDRDRS